MLALQHPPLAVRRSRRLRPNPNVGARQRLSVHPAHSNALLSHDSPARHIIPSAQRRDELIAFRCRSSLAGALQSADVGIGPGWQLQPTAYPAVNSRLMVRPAHGRCWCRRAERGDPGWVASQVQARSTSRPPDGSPTCAPGRPSRSAPGTAPSAQPPSLATEPQRAGAFVRGKSAAVVHSRATIDRLPHCSLLGPGDAAHCPAWRHRYVGWAACFPRSIYGLPLLARCAVQAIRSACRAPRWTERSAQQSSILLNEPARASMFCSAE